MASKMRVPIQVSPLFREELTKAQKRFEGQKGKTIGLREFSEMIAKSTLISDIEKQLLKKANNGDIRINFDARRKR